LGLNPAQLKNGWKVFHIVVYTNAAICQQFLKVHHVNAYNFAGAKTDVVLLEERVGTASPKENRNFSA
jgi:hypothetical protein